MVDQEMEELKSEIKELKSEIKELKNEIKELKATSPEDRPFREQRLAALEQRLAALEQRLIDKERRAAQAAEAAAASSSRAGSGGGAASVFNVPSSLHTDQLAQSLQQLAQVLPQLAQVVPLLKQLMQANVADRFRYSTSQATNHSRIAGFKQNLVKAYGETANFQDGRCRCLLLNHVYPSKLVVGSHLFKFSWASHVEHVMNFPNINDTRNGLLLFKPLEEAFDSSFLIFEWLPRENTWKAHWLGDDKLKISDIYHYPWESPTDEQKLPDLQKELGRLHPEDTFKSLVDGKKLVFTTDARPFKRCLAFQAHKAIQRARSIGLIDDHWLLGKNFKTASPVATNVQAYLDSIPLDGAEPPVDDPPEDEDTVSEGSSQAVDVQGD